MANRYVWDRYNYQLNALRTINSPGSLGDMTTNGMSVFCSGSIGVGNNNEITLLGAQVDSYPVFSGSTYIGGPYFYVEVADAAHTRLPGRGVYHTDGCTVRFDSSGIRYELRLTDGVVIQYDKYVKGNTKYSSVSNASNATYPPLNNRDKITNICTIRRWSNVA